MTASDAHESAAHFTRRLESFTDIVFGFSLSFLGSRLVVPDAASEVFAHPRDLFAFFVTFGAMVGLWLANHRQFRYFFEPKPLDVALVFAQLSMIAILPYALQLYLRFSFSPVTIAFYNSVFGLLLAFGTALSYRGFRRKWPTWDKPERIRRWQGVVSQGAVSAVFLFGIAMLRVNVEIAHFSYFLLPAATLAIRRFYRGLPRFARVE